jgi:hypothetical protein
VNINNSTIENLVDLICLLYHEARNVRYPIKAGKIQDGDKYGKLINLPNNKYQAWRHMSKVRTKAIATQVPADASKVFKREFGLSLEDLLELYLAPCWKDSAYGGNKWAPICSRVRDLIEARESGDEAHYAQLFETILRMEHNTGTVERKLHGLKNA